MDLVTESSSVASDVEVVTLITGSEGLCKNSQVAVLVINCWTCIITRVI